MISVEEARARILKDLATLPDEWVSLSDAAGRVLAADIRARLTQPPADVSAMDGYGVRAADCATVPASLRVVGNAPAGHPFAGRVGPGEAVRLFTGSVIPDGADAVVIQEDTAREGDRVTIREASAVGRHIRKRGLDFAEGELALAAPRRLTARDIGFAAAANHPWLPVRRRPRVALLATGDEIVMPGEPLGPGGIVSSNTHALAALVRAAGGEAVNLGIAADTPEALAGFAAGLQQADLIVTTGGASVGEHDLIQQVLEPLGLAVDFWKVAMRPGKPLIAGSFRGTPMLGLPGNPVSAMVCGVLFIMPALARLLGLADTAPPTIRVRLAVPLKANDVRADHLRATLAPGPDGVPEATPFPVQDSSMMSRLARADCLVLRAPHAPPAAAGEMAEAVPLAALGI